MISITQIKAALREVIAEAPEVARQTGFVQRERNFDGAGFFLFLLFGWLEHAEAPLEELTQVAQDCAITISASGLSQRRVRPVHAGDDGAAVAEADAGRPGRHPVVAALQRSDRGR